MWCDSTCKDFGTDELGKCRWVVDGNVWTSAGVSAGIDMALHFVLQKFGKGMADELASHMEYDGNYVDGSHDHWGSAL